MKTLKQVIEDNQDHEIIIKEVVEKIDYDRIADVLGHGIDSGFDGFIYHRDTCTFYIHHREHINQWIKDMAEDCGQSAIEFVQSFNCLKEANWTEEIGLCIYGGKVNEETTQIENALAWFAAEEVCRMFEK